MRIRITIAAAALLLSSCGLGGLNRMGISRGPGNTIRVHYVTCPGEVVTRLALMGNVESVAWEGGNDVPADDSESDEYVVWQAASQGSTDRTFDVPGEVPGFVVEQALTTSLDEVGGLAIFIGSKKEGYESVQMAFDLEDLPSSGVHAGKTYSVAEFEKRAEADCS